MNESHKDTSTPAISLSAAHSIALQARMLTLEEDCREMERFLEGFTGVFYSYGGVPPEAARQTIRTLISEILRGIERIRLDLGLPHRQTEVGRLLAAHYSRMWVTLQETDAASLRGYGEVPDELAAYLQPRVDELLGFVASLRDAIEWGTKPPAPGEAEGKSG